MHFSFLVWHNSVLSLITSQLYTLNLSGFNLSLSLNLVVALLVCNKRFNCADVQ